MVVMMMLTLLPGAIVETPIGTSWIISYGHTIQLCITALIIIMLDRDRLNTAMSSYQYRIPITKMMFISSL